MPEDKDVKQQIKMLKQLIGKYEKDPKIMAQGGRNFFGDPIIEMLEIQIDTLKKCLSCEIDADERSEEMFNEYGDDVLEDPLLKAEDEALQYYMDYMDELVCQDDLE